MEIYGTTAMRNGASMQGLKYRDEFPVTICHLQETYPLFVDAPILYRRHYSFSLASMFHERNLISWHDLEIPIRRKYVESSSSVSIIPLETARGAPFASAPITNIPLIIVNSLQFFTSLETPANPTRTRDSAYPDLVSFAAKGRQIPLLSLELKNLCFKLLHGGIETIRCSM